ncbi:MAG: acetate/propionate family kinase [Flavobacteriaceae bacterium]
MNILIINTGSSSIKFQLIEMPKELVISSGMVERIGNRDAVLNFYSNGSQIKEEAVVADHAEGLEKITDFLFGLETGSISSAEDINAVGHRVVHGGNAFSNTCVIDETVKGRIEEYAVMAPLHNPHNLTGVNIAEKLFPMAKQVAVFDTAFHQTIPVKAHKYAIPNELYSRHEIKMYGFHGTSHAYVVKQAIDFLPEKSSKIISVHLGNGCSITAVKEGKSIDTSLGFGPSNGLIMGTRSGDIDHSLIFYMSKNLGYEIDEVKSILDKDSGMLGLTGYSDLRDIQAAAQEGDKNCILALQMNAYRIKKYIGAYTAAMNGLDTLIFTAGIGENSGLLRALVCEELDYLGIRLDKEENMAKSADIRAIDSGDLAVSILVIPTNEELEIARQVFLLLR